MKIHEYQAKTILKQYQIPVPEEHVARSLEEAKSAAEMIGFPLVVKAQVHVGGRGKAGGVKLAKDSTELESHVSDILGMEIKGEVVKTLLISQGVEIQSESYLGIVLDRKGKSPMILASRSGGVDIEEVARKTPEKIIRFSVDPILGLQAFQAREIGFSLFPEKKQAFAVAKILLGLYKAFEEKDSTLTEINPLVEKKDGTLIAVDAKMNFDDNALHKHKDIQKMRELDEKEKLEIEAKEKGLSYIRLDGEIGCVVNGAGLAMATMDIIKKYGGNPANFLDVGGSSDPEKVVQAIKFTTSDPHVKVIFFNIFGGITRCDDIAKGLKIALEKIDVKVPIVIRLTGTNEEEGQKLLKNLDVNIVHSMAEGAKKSVEMAKERK